jgi:uridine kinase
MVKELRETQISAFVSDTTKERLERYVRKRGVKKGYVLEQALSQYLTALEEIPEEYIVPTRIVLAKESFDRVVDLIEHPPKPTKELKQLMKRAKRYLPK